MYKLNYTQTTRKSVRANFTFEATGSGIEIPGQILERDKPGLDKYYWTFASRFLWEVGDTLPPFKATFDNRDVSFDLFFGVPQLLLKHLFDFEPSACSKYKTGEYRSCKNCTYLQFSQSTWDEYSSRPISQRYDRSPSFYICQVNGDAIDHQSQLESTRGRALDSSKKIISQNSCTAHTRNAYQVDTSLESRAFNGPSTRWVPAEHRRLHCLNPETITINGTKATIAGIPILLKEI